MLINTQNIKKLAYKTKNTLEIYNFFTFKNLQKILFDINYNIKLQIISKKYNLKCIIIINKEP